MQTIVRNSRLGQKPGLKKPRGGGGPSGLRVASYAVAGLGVAALAVGTAMGVMSQGEAGQLKTDRTLTYNQANTLAQNANTKGLVANVLWGVGGAAVAGGVVMCLPVGRIVVLVGVEVSLWFISRQQPHPKDSPVRAFQRSSEHDVHTVLP